MLDSSAAVKTISSDFSVQDGRLAVHSTAAVTPVERHRGVVALVKTTHPIGDSATDQDLGRALMERHPDALSAAWRRYRPMVLRMLRRALGAEGDIEDLVQDVFLCLFRRAPALRDAEAVRPFVIGIARHTLYRERRRRMRRQRLALRFGLQTEDTPSVGGGPATSYAIIKLNGLLRRLTEQERTSFVLRFGHGMTVPEVADALCVSEPTAKRRLSRARECLGAWVASDPFLVNYLRGENRAEQHG